MAKARKPRTTLKRRKTNKKKDRYDKGSQCDRPGGKPRRRAPKKK